MNSTKADNRFTLSVDRIAKGGAALGQGPDGRVVFCQGAIPGETVLAQVTAQHAKRIEAVAVEVLEASPDRVEPVCAHVAHGCGGCDWQHVAESAQPALRRSIVADALRRLGRIEGVPITSARPLPALGYRSTVRAGVLDGRAGLRKGSSNEIIVVDACPTAHPLVEELLVEGRFGDADEVTIRVGVNTGERMVIVDGSVSAAGSGLKVPGDVKVVGRDELATSDHQPHYHESVAGIRLQISADSFFQCRVDGAELLAELAGDAVSAFPGTLLDAYGGVGLFGTVAGTGRTIIGVESHPPAVVDAAYNYGPHGRAVRSRLESWKVEPVGAVIADPARAGLKSAGCDKLAETGAAVIALVSCDPASLARDASLLQERGYGLDSVVVVDLFGNTSHVETVSRFVADQST